MNKIICRGSRFPVEIIQRAIWLYYRFTLSLRDVEELLAERGIEVTYETIRQWGIQFGPAIARDLRSRRPRPHSRWHMDEMFVSIGGKRMYLWRAVDHEGVVTAMGWLPSTPRGRVPRWPPSFISTTPFLHRLSGTRYGFTFASLFAIATSRTSSLS